MWHERERISTLELMEPSLKSLSSLLNGTLDFGRATPFGMGWDGVAERAIEWGEQAIGWRMADPLGVAFGHVIPSTVDSWRVGQAAPLLDQALPMEPGKSGMVGNDGPQTGHDSLW